MESMPNLLQAAALKHVVLYELDKSFVTCEHEISVIFKRLKKAAAMPQVKMSKFLALFS